MPKNITTGARPIVRGEFDYAGKFDCAAVLEKYSLPASFKKYLSIAYFTNPYSYLPRLDTRPRSRANGAEDDSPGQRPGYRAPCKLNRPERAEGNPAPFQGAPQSMDSGTQGVALG